MPYVKGKGELPSPHLLLNENIDADTMLKNIKAATMKKIIAAAREAHDGDVTTRALKDLFEITKGIKEIEDRDRRANAYASMTDAEYIQMLGDLAVQKGFALVEVTGKKRLP